MSSTPDSLRQRYGSPSRGGRTLVVVLGGMLVLGFLGWLAWATLFHADPAVSSRELGHQIVDNHTATIKVRIEYGGGPVEATCSLRAISTDKAVVGETSFQPDRDGIHEVEVRTDRRATTVEWLGCTTDGQPRPR